MYAAVGRVHIRFIHEYYVGWMASSHVVDAMEEPLEGVAILAFIQEFFDYSVVAAIS